jgi:hypothetical protein
MEVGEIRRRRKRSLLSATPSTSPEPATPRLTTAEKAMTSKRLRVGVRGLLAPEMN